uniref:Replication factor A C-terminal domain-containing protein n=1 Tax=Chenopodium quinoa TaxID=63459 RepID=A0A803LSU5_CHEQI
MENKEVDCQMTFGGNTTIHPLQAEAGPCFLSTFQLLLFRASSKDVIRVILYMEQVRQVKTASGAIIDVCEVVIDDDIIYQPQILSLWGGLATKGCEKLADWASSPLIVGFIYMRPTCHKGFSLASSMSTSVILWPSRETAEHLKKCMCIIKFVILILQLTDAMQEERLWLEAKIAEPDVKKIITYIGCDNCGRRCEELVGETFKCSSWPNKFYTATARVNYTFPITDGTGELKLTAFGAECEKLFSMELADIHSKVTTEYWDAFDEAVARLSTKEAYFCVEPTNILSRVGALRWALKSVSME